MGTRVVAGLVVGTAMGLVVYGSGAWLVAWLVWGAAIGLLVARWWAVILAVLALPVGFAVNLIGTQGELDDHGWFTEVFGAFVPSVTAIAGIVVGIAVVMASGRLRRRLERARG